jgi:hypothetical protein
MNTADRLNEAFDGLDKDIGELLKRYRRVKAERDALLAAAKLIDGKFPGMALQNQTDEYERRLQELNHAHQQQMERNADMALLHAAITKCEAE